MVLNSGPFFFIKIFLRKTRILTGLPHDKSTDIMAVFCTEDAVVSIGSPPFEWSKTLGFLLEMNHPWFIRKWCKGSRGIFQVKYLCIAIAGLIHGLQVRVAVQHVLLCLYPVIQHGSGLDPQPVTAVECADLYLGISQNLSGNIFTLPVWI